MYAESQTPFGLMCILSGPNEITAIEPADTSIGQEITIGPQLILLGRSYRAILINRFSFQ